MDERAQIVRTEVVPTRAAEGFEVSFGQVCAVIDALLTSETEAIGICAPGPLNPKTGVILNPPNMFGWRDVPLAELISRKYGRPARVENDANAAGLAETLFGAARGFASVFYVTLSTGIGAGIILDGKIYHGKNGAAAEGGHVSIDYQSATVCTCGTPGCIEALASGSALMARGVRPESMTSSEIQEMTTMLAAWMGSIVSLLDPEIIVIGGGMAQIGETLFRQLREKLPHRTINQFAGEIPIVPAQLAANAGIIGAASIVLGEQKQ